MILSVYVIYTVDWFNHAIVCFSAMMAEAVVSLMHLPAIIVVMPVFKI